MGDYTLTIPETLYDRVREFAERQHESVERFVYQRLEQSLSAPFSDLPHDEQAELAALAYLSDDTLWTIAREQMPAHKQAIMHPLMDKNSRGTITPSEYAELEQLVEQGQRLMLRKAEAMRQLKTRGYAVTLDMLKPADEL